MIKINKTKESDKQHEFLVTINSDGETEHKVYVDKDYYAKLTNNKITVEQLLEKSFRFLLQKESNKSILPEFNLKVISKYFPEYESEIGV